MFSSDQLQQIGRSMSRDGRTFGDELAFGGRGQRRLPVILRVAWLARELHAEAAQTTLSVLPELRGAQC
jgi:hypothetical protein